MTIVTIDKKALMFMKILNSLDLDDVDEYQFAVNSISDAIYKYLDYKFTGKISVKAYRMYRRGTPKSKLCKEHFRPRTTIARMIVKRHKEGTLSMFALKRILDEAREINLVTTKENKNLAAFQRDGTLNHEEHYRLAGVKLVDFVEIVKTNPFRITVGEISNVFQTKAEAKRYGFGTKLLSLFKEEPIVIILKRTNRLTQHLYKAGDEIKYERV